MSDGSGGAPQLDERALEVALRAAIAHPAHFPNSSANIKVAIRAYLAASSGALELDLTETDVRSALEMIEAHGPLTKDRHVAVRSKLRARLDRKDDEDGL